MALEDDIHALIRTSGLKGGELKKALRAAIARDWPDMPPWTTLPAPEIEETHKANVGAGVTVVFRENGVLKTLVALAGSHYKKTDDAYMIPGGFINLTTTPGSSHVAASDAPEDGRTGAAREVEEEFRLPTGAPLLSVEPSRLVPVDTKTLAFPGNQRRVVMGFMLELTADEVKTVRTHVDRQHSDPAYRDACAAQSINHDSGLPEVTSLDILPLAEVAAGKVPLLHGDQRSLFQLTQERLSPTTPRQGPTTTTARKESDVAGIAAKVATWRADGDVTIGITSGAFDILHPGHISFLEDARRQCDHLIVIVASDRTIREQKGQERPFVPADKRAQTIAALESVGAVVISDEYYHETILKAVRPDVLFKGDDYAGVEIKGADLAGRVQLIPCAEKEFYSSSAFAKKIMAAKRT